MSIKVFGITQLKQLQQLDAMDIDFAGLNFYKESQRYMGDKISAQGVRAADFDIKKVGVFVNQNYDEIMKIVNDFQASLKAEPPIPVGTPDPYVPTSRE